MKIAALFAGIGGLERGLHEAGHETIMTCEISEHAIAVLAKHYPGIPNSPDVSKLETLPREVELVTAGFPCQDLSQAGMTAGIRGRRSGLVDRVFKLLDKRKVPIVVLENVSFMLALDRGAAMHRLTQAFERRGYRWAYRTVNSLAFLPQRRERVFFVATSCELDPARVLFADEVDAHKQETTLDTHAHGFYWTEGTRGLGWAPNAIPTLKNGSTIGIPSPPAILMPDGVVIKPSVRDAERLQGFDVDWTASAPERLRWSLVGNAVTVPVAAWLGERLSMPGDYDAMRDQPWPKSINRFPRAARFDGKRRHVVRITDFPVWKEREPLHKFLRYPGVPLSARATSGFLSRAEASSLRFVPGFLERLRIHLGRMLNEETKLKAATPPKPRRRVKSQVLVAAE
jgi:DNA (cytosine-5)-methyltransferase 1